MKNQDGTTSTTGKWWRAVVRAIACAASVAVAVCRANAELPREIRVVTYNIRHGEGMDHKIDLKRIAKVLVAAKPYMWALEEVDQGVKRTSRVDQPAEFARLTGKKAVFGRNITFQGG